MTQVIDSLKRLERIGTESSKSNQKLIQAARDLEEKIVDASGVNAEEEEVELKGGLSIVQGCLIFSRTFWDALERYNEGGQNDDVPEPEAADFRVSASASNALSFARMIAAGALEQIAEALEKRQQEMEKASNDLTAALHQIK